MRELTYERDVKYRDTPVLVAITEHQIDDRTTPVLIAGWATGGILLFVSLTTFYAVWLTRPLNSVAPHQR